MSDQQINVKTGWERAFQVCVVPSRYMRFPSFQLKRNFHPLIYGHYRFWRLVRIFSWS